MLGWLLKMCSNKSKSEPAIPIEGLCSALLSRSTLALRKPPEDYLVKEWVARYYGPRGTALYEQCLGVWLKLVYGPTQIEVKEKQETKETQIKPTAQEPSKPLTNEQIMSALMHYLSSIYNETPESCYQTFMECSDRHHNRSTSYDLPPGFKVPKP